MIENGTVSPGYWPLTGERRATRFHTGYLARWLPDGDLVMIGRRDDRVKIGGIRIEPGEIESALRTHQAVAEAVVLATEDHLGEPVLLPACCVQQQDDFEN